MPISIPDMDVDAAYMPIRIYPAITPIFNGMYVRFRLILRITRTDFAFGEICGLFFVILFMDVHPARRTVFLEMTLAARSRFSLVSGHVVVR